MSERLKYSKYPTSLGFTLHSEANCGKHIEKIADKARNRLKILKYLSGSDRGSEVSTLRITYTTLLHVVLEYRYQIFQVASSTNLIKLERVQLSAAKIITGLRYSCPIDIVLYEADIQPLTMRFEVNSYSHPELLRQLAPEVIKEIPDQAFIIYTDGSRSDTGRARSGIFSNTPWNDVKISSRNSDYCSVFRSELIDISGALDSDLNSNKDSI
ncbi:RNase H domain-containing protein [Trichonephila clavipes]|nr:RNase H domain-containing protein [Trichonephila clavipes]